MATYIINFNSNKDKRILHNFLKTLKSVYKIKLSKVRKYEGRYKYYFGHVLRVIAEKEIYASSTSGEVLTGTELHNILKVIYNPLIVLHPVDGRIFVKGKSTTELSDGNFIGDYEAQIIADHSQPPYYCDFIDREIWTQNKIDSYNEIN